MKVQFHKIYLNEDHLVDSICKIITLNYKRFIYCLELEECGLTSKPLAKIIEEIRYCNQNLRQVNLSYNCLGRDKDSDLFVDHLCDYIDAQKMLAHLNISGMNFSKEHIVQISQKVAKAEYLCSVHMSDNAINLYD